MLRSGDRFTDYVLSLRVPQRLPVQLQTTIAHEGSNVITPVRWCYPIFLG